MSNITQKGDAIRSAVKWISDCRQDDPASDLDQLLETAAVKFNLSPKETIFLTRFVRENGDPETLSIPE
jgi:hypothetical protein